MNDIKEVELDLMFQQFIRINDEFTDYFRNEMTEFMSSLVLPNDAIGCRFILKVDGRACFLLKDIRYFNGFKFNISANIYQMRALLSLVFNNGSGVIFKLEKVQVA